MSRIIEVRGAASRTGKTTVLVNLATMFARQHKVLYLHLGMGRDELGRWFDLPPPPRGPRWLHDRRERITDNLEVVRDMWDVRVDIDRLHREYHYLFLDTERASYSFRAPNLTLVAGGLNVFELGSLPTLKEELTGKRTLAVWQERWWPETDEEFEPEEEAEMAAYRAEQPGLFAAAYAAVAPLWKIGLDAASETALRSYRPAPPGSQSWQGYQHLAREIAAQCQEQQG